MNCKQIREEIDAASRYDLRGAIRSHLNGCPDCRRYSDETAALLGLLGAQPRVEAPADFEFQLRARIARAQAAAESDRRSFWRKIRPETFSWGQMAAAAATLALAVTVSTFYVKRDDRAARIDPAGDARTAISAGDRQSDAAGGGEFSPGIDMLAARPAGAAPFKYMSKSQRVGLTSYQSKSQIEGQFEVPASPNDIADNDGSTRLYNPETKRLLNDRSRFYGAETVSISQSDTTGKRGSF
jgi:hypothetical protein